MTCTTGFVNSEVCATHERALNIVDGQPLLVT
jgi:hypothetical protein